MRRKIKVQIWQTNDADIAFRSYDAIGRRVYLSKYGYKLVYEFNFVTYNDNYMLSLPEKVVEWFNNKIPANYEGRSVSVSDLLRFEENGNDAVWMYVDTEELSFAWVTR